jgi:hypothetical protein
MPIIGRKKMSKYGDEFSKEISKDITAGMLAALPGSILKKEETNTYKTVLRKSDAHLMKKFETIKNFTYTEQEAIFGIKLILSNIIM